MRQDISARILTFPLILAIYFYRFAFGPILGGNCRFYPSCSQYAEDAIREQGAYRGSISAIKRLMKCHPWHEGGYDPVEQTNQQHYIE